MHTKLSRAMQLALEDLPIQHVPSESPLRRHHETMYWTGESGNTYNYNTLKGLMKRGLIQYIPATFNAMFAELVKREPKHNSAGFIRYNEIFGVSAKEIKI